MRGGAESIGCFPTGRHYPGIAHLLRIVVAGLAEEFAGDQVEGHDEEDARGDRGGLGGHLPRFGAVASERRVIHLIAVVLRELDIEPILAQAKKLDAVRANGFGHLHPQLRRAPPAYVEHQHGHRRRSVADLRDTPCTAFAKLSNGHRDSSNIDTHHGGVSRADARGEFPLCLDGVARVHVQLKVRHFTLQSPHGFSHDAPRGVNAPMVEPASVARANRQAGSMRLRSHDLARADRCHSRRAGELLYITAEQDDDPLHSRIATCSVIRDIGADGHRIDERSES